jgi:hypothetical protein
MRKIVITEAGKDALAILAVVNNGCETRYEIHGMANCAHTIGKACMERTLKLLTEQGWLNEEKVE